MHIWSFEGDIAGAIRQWRYPREFRIAAPLQLDSVVKGLKEELDDLERTLELTKTVGESVQQSGAPVYLSNVCTALWRARSSLIDDDSDEPKKETRKTFLHVQSMLDVLEDHNIRVVGHTGELWSDGLLLDAIAFEVDPELERPEIIQTIRPSIYWEDVQVQIGQVIVGEPAGDAKKFEDREI